MDSPAALYKGFSQVGSPSACVCDQGWDMGNVPHPIPGSSLPILVDSLLVRVTDPLTSP